MHRHTKILGAAALFGALLAACSNDHDGGNGGAPPSAGSDAFIGYVQQLVATAPDDTEPADVEAPNATAPEDVEPVEVS